MKLQLVILAVALSTSAAVASNQPGNKPSVLDRLCKSEPVKIESVVDALELCWKLRKAPNQECPAHIRSGLLELGSMLEVPYEEVCSRELARRMRQFYLDYLETSTSRTTKNVPRINDGLKNVALAYATHISNTCSWRMYLTLFDSNLEAPLVDEIGQLINLTRRRPERLLNKLRKSNHNDLLQELGALIGGNEDDVGGKQVGMDKIYVQSEDIMPILDAKAVCAKRFEPYYEKLITPVALLASVGFNHRDEQLEDYLKQDWPTTALEQWAKVVFLCENLKLVEPIEMPETVEKVTSLEASERETEKSASKTSFLHGLLAMGKSKADRSVTLRIISNEEAAKIKQELAAAGRKARESDYETSLEQAKFIVRERSYKSSVPLLLSGLDNWFTRPRREFINEFSTWQQTALRRIRTNFMDLTLKALEQNLLASHSISLLVSTPMENLAQRTGQPETSTVAEGGKLTSNQLKALMLEKLKANKFHGREEALVKPLSAILETVSFEAFVALVVVTGLYTSDGIMPFPATSY